MRLSEMTNKVCIEKVIEITPYLGEIMQDEELISIFYDRLDISEMDEKEGKIKGLAKGVSNFNVEPVVTKSSNTMQFCSRGNTLSENTAPIRFLLWQCATSS